MQVIIPDLEDDEVFGDKIPLQPPPRIHSPSATVATGASGGTSGSDRPSLEDGNGPFSAGPFLHSNTGSFGSSSTAYNHPNTSGPFRGAALGWHGRSGSATSDSSAGGGASYRFPSSDPKMASAAVASSSGTQGGGSFSFPVKKSSFASLRAAIRGQNHSNSATNATPQPLPREREAAQEYFPLGLRNVSARGTASETSETQGTKRSASAATPRQGGGVLGYGQPNNFIYQTGSGGLVTSPISSSRISHTRNDSQVSGHSRANTSGGTGSVGPGIGTWRYNHVHQSSYYSDFSAGGISSSGASALVHGGGHGGGHVGVLPPPVPPLPFNSEYHDPGPGTPSASNNMAVFSDLRTMASGAQLEASDLGSPYGGRPVRLRENSDPQGHSWGPSSMDEASSVDFTPFRAAAREANDEMMRIAGGSKTPTVARSSAQRSARQGLSSGEPALEDLPFGIGSSDPKTPADYALNILTSRFITLAGQKMESALHKGLDADPAALCANVPKSDDPFEPLLESLAHLSRRNAAQVVDSLLRWRATQADARIDARTVRRNLMESQYAHSSGVGAKDIATLLARKKGLLSIHLLCRALIEVAKQLGRDSMSEIEAEDLERRVLEMLQDCVRDRERITIRGTEVMRQSCFEILCVLIGELSRTRFTSIAEKFRNILETAADQAQKTQSKVTEDLTEAAIHSMRHLRIQVYPPDQFEESIEFLEFIAKQFNECHGSRLKQAFAELFLHLVLPVAKSASAELHHPTWIRATEAVLPRVTAMAAKPRYWHVAYPLQVALLASSTEDKVLPQWLPCVEAGATRLKDRESRAIVMNSAVRILWVYVFRCHESNATTAKRLESFFRLWFPSNRDAVIPSDGANDPHILMVHFVLYRHFDFGRDLVLQFLRQTTLSGKTLSLQPHSLSRQRMIIAIRAILLTLDSYVKEEQPALPSNPNFTHYDLDVSRDGLGDELPSSFSYPRMEIGDAQATFNDLIGKVALICDHQLSELTLFDEKAVLSRGTGSSGNPSAGERQTLDREGFVWKSHPLSKLVVAYNRENQPYCDLLRACFDSWPRCLSPNITLSSILSVLFRAHYSSDPRLADASSDALRRIAMQRKGGSALVVAGFMRWIFRPETAFWEIHPSQTLLLHKIELSVKLWIEFLNAWLTELRAHPSEPSGSATPGLKGFEMERTSAWAIIDEVEAYGIFLLCSGWRPLRRQAIQVLRLVTALDDAFLSPARKTAMEADRDAGEEQEPSRVIHLLDMGADSFIAEEEATQASWSSYGSFQAEPLTRLQQKLGSLAASDSANDHSLWQKAIPQFLKMCLDRFPTTVAVFRSYVTNRILGMDQAIAIAAGTIPRLPNNPSAGNGASKVTLSFSASSPGPGALTQEQILMCEHWKFYILALCMTTTSTDGSRGGVLASHRRQPSEGETGERVIAARDLFQKLMPFLASSQTRFKDAVVTALGSINDNLYRTLLDVIQAISSQLNEEFKSRSVARSGHKRNKRHERLRIAVGQILHLTSHHILKESNFADRHLVQIILTWVAETFAFLTDREIRQDWEFHRLRRFFCAVVEDFFDAIAKSGDTERYFTFDVRSRMFRALKDWHSYSQTCEEGPSKLANLLANAAERIRDEKVREQTVILLRNETQSLAYQACRAMAALCQGTISLVGGTTPMPMPGTSLEALSLLSWLGNLFSSIHPRNHAVAKRALRSLLLYNENHETLISGVLEKSFSEPESLIGDRSFFTVLAEVLIEKDDYDIPLHQAFCLGLIKLGHAAKPTRMKALTLLQTIARRHEKGFDSDGIEVGVSSPLPAMHLHAQRRISSTLANHFSALKTAMVSEFALRLPGISSIRRGTILNLMPAWLQGVETSPTSSGLEEDAEISYSTYIILSDLFYLSIKYGDEHSFEMQRVWESLAGDSKSNADAILHYLVKQSLRFRDQEFVLHSQTVISWLSRTNVGSHIFEELCSSIVPSNMIPTPRGDLSTYRNPELGGLFLADLDRLFPSSGKRVTFSPGQVALLLVGELAFEMKEQLVAFLPTLLHAIFLQFDSVSAFVQEQAIGIFEQLLRSLVCHGNAGGGPTQGDMTSLPKDQVEALFQKSSSDLFWPQKDVADDKDQTKTPANMRSTLRATLSIIESLFPMLREDWGAVALFWATSGPVRHMACRSFQAFRILMPTVTPSMLADMLGRLSDTVSDPKEDIQSFALEILYTVNAVIRANAIISKDFFALCWWATLACLSTINEREFIEAISMLDSLLEKLDVGSADVVNMLTSKCPEGWEGDKGGVQQLVLRGLRSSKTSDASFAVLASLASCEDATLVNPDAKSRLGFTFVAALPWFLQVTDDNFQSQGSASSPTDKSPISLELRSTVIKLATDLAKLAESLSINDIQRVATSVSKFRFRTKDDLVRQAVGCIKANYLPGCGPEFAVHLLGLTLNQNDWLRKQTMQILKIFFQVVDTKAEAFSSLGSELLMPLLRLLSTPLADRALEVLDEPISVNGGPASNQILRMSLQWGKPDRKREHVSDASIFGAPDDSGWAVAHPQDLTTRTRINIQAVFKTCERTLDVAPTSSNVNFVVDDGYEVAELEQTLFASDQATVTGPANLGDIVNQLHDLSSFFVDSEPFDSRGGYSSPATPSRISRRGHERRGLSDSNGLYRGQASRHPFNYMSEVEGGEGIADPLLSLRSHAHIAKILGRSASKNGPGAWSAYGHMSRTRSGEGVGRADVQAYYSSPKNGRKAVTAPSHMRAPSSSRNLYDLGNVSMMDGRNLAMGSLLDHGRQHLHQKSDSLDQVRGSEEDDEIGRNGAIISDLVAARDELDRNREDLDEDQEDEVDVALTVDETADNDPYGGLAQVQESQRHTPSKSLPSNTMALSRTDSLDHLDLTPPHAVRRGQVATTGAEASRGGSLRTRPKFSRSNTIPNEMASITTPNSSFPLALAGSDQGQGGGGDPTHRLGSENL
ncbi:hypothetical protein IE53DRAFT_48994 [Violaceomyces palustris]|uniref:Uncharacterized protein n=1 Tax=Violaceomyces palustris TaxID=1673888 RepID=A0ACD0P0B2_9BASI|nr:hypothetical protein IE53DRAFT_48994 [Violaceomyces palustris]